MSGQTFAILGHSNFTLISKIDFPSRQPITFQKACNQQYSYSIISIVFLQKIQEDEVTKRKQCANEKQ